MTAISSLSGGSALYATTSPAKHSLEVDQYLASKDPNGTAKGSELQLENVGISSTASTLSDLLDAANKYIQSNYQASDVTYKDGYTSVNAYLNVKKYNDFLFDNAASQMVAKGADMGISIDKDQLVQTLRQSNLAISSITDNNDVRTETLNVDGITSSYSRLTDSDRNALTDQFIAEKMAGGDGGNTELAAAYLADARFQQAIGAPIPGVDETVVQAPKVQEVSSAPNMNVLNQGRGVSSSDFGRAILTQMMQAGTVSAETLISSLAPASTTQNTSGDGALQSGASADKASGK